MLKLFKHGILSAVLVIGFLPFMSQAKGLDVQTVKPTLLLTQTQGAVQLAHHGRRHWRGRHWRGRHWRHRYRHHRWWIGPRYYRGGYIRCWHGAYGRVCRRYYY